MEKLQSLQSFLAPPTVEVQISTVLINLIIAALLATVLRIVYERYGLSFSNRRMFGANFVLLACTTTLIITVVKSSLALSLGLVGALSIIRFRSAIKEPEELAYLFLTIAIGLGLGADQREVTFGAFLVIAGIIVVRGVFRQRDLAKNLLITVSSHDLGRTSLDQIVQILRETCAAVTLHRYDERGDMLEACFSVEFDDFSQLESSRQKLRGLSHGMQVSFVNNCGIV